MIKLGCYAVMQDEKGQLVDVETFTHFARTLNLDMIDYHLGKGFLSRDPDYLLRLKTLCLKSGLPIGYVASGGGFVGAEQELRQKVDKAKADVDIAAFMGSPMIRLFGGRPRDDDPDPESTWSDTVRCFQEVADYAATKAIALGLQNHGPPARPRGEDILRILHDTDRDNMSLIMDTGQWWPDYGSNQGGDFVPNENIYDYMEQVAPHASYVRAKIYKIDTGREEYIDYERVIRILQAVDFNGAISVVYEGRRYSRCDDCEAIRLGVNHLRELLDAARV